MTTQKLLREAYMTIRRRVRSFVTRHPVVDLALGSALVALDLSFRRLGIVDLSLGSDRFEYDGLMRHFSSFLDSRQDLLGESP